MSRETAFGQIEPVERDARLDRQLRDDLDAAPTQIERRTVAAPEAAGPHGDDPAQRSLLAERIRDPGVTEPITANRQRDPPCDGERLEEHLIAVGRGQREQIAVLELDLEPRVLRARREQAGVGRQYIAQRTGHAEPSDPVDRHGPRAEPQRGGRLPHVDAANEPHFRQEVVFDDHMPGRHPVAVTRVVELTAETRVAPGPAPCPGAGRVSEDVDVIEEGKPAVEPVGLVASAVPFERDRAIGDDAADGAAAQDVPFDPQDREVGRLDRRQHLLAGLRIHHAGPRAGLDVQRPDVEGADLAGQPSTRPNRHHPRALQPDLAAEEQGGQPAAEVPAALGEVEVAPTLQEELALLREEQAEPRQVDLLLVHLDLGEVGVEGEVCRQVARHAVLDVEPGLAVRGVAHRRRGREVRGDAADGVRLDLEVHTLGRRLEPHERTGLRHAPEPRDDAVSARRRDRQRRQIRGLGAAPDDAAELQSPDLDGPRTIAQRLEGDADLDRPAAVEPSGPRVPDRVPVAVDAASLVRHLEVGETANRVDQECDAVAPVVEGVQQHRERIVLPQLNHVAAHLVRHPFIRRRGVVAACRDIDVLVVEQHPGFRPLAARLTFIRQLLDEVGDEPDVLEHRLVKLPVKADRLVHAGGPHRRAAVRVARHHRRGDRLRRPLQHRRRAGRDRLRVGACRHRRREQHHPNNAAATAAAGPPRNLHE